MSVRESTESSKHYVKINVHFQSCWIQGGDQLLSHKTSLFVYDMY